MAEVVASIRAGGPADAAAVVALFDEAVAWLVARGQLGQWGDTPFSRSDSRVAGVTEMAAGGGLRLAVAADGEPLGAIVIGARPAWVASAEEPERYIEALVTSRRHAGAEIGAALVARAVEETRAAGVALLRVDCWGDAPGLVAWYERQGFHRSGTFTLEDWHGQLLAMRV